MSVLKSKRTLSGGEFVNVANQIYVQTIAFLTRLSARYSRLIAEPTAALAGEVMDYAEKANATFPKDDMTRTKRREYLLSANASLSALDVRLTHCYMIINQNPGGAFTTSSGKTVDGKEAVTKIDKMAQTLGELIDREKDLLRGQIEKLSVKKM